MKKLSLYDLTYGYLKKYYNGAIDDKLKSETMKAIKDALKQKWTVSDITHAIVANHNSKGSHKDFLYTLKNGTHSHKNILNPDNFYWHPQLRITPPAPKKVIDYDRGEIKSVDEEHFMEMVASYTEEQLMKYYIKQHGAVPGSKYNKYLGGLSYLLKNHNIDTVLFMIDASANFIKEGDLSPLSSPLDMDRYEQEAKFALGEKITEERQAGDDRVVPRRRLPLR